MHPDPPVGPPRYDLRSYLDEDVKEETKEGVKEPMDGVAKKKRKHPLLRPR